MANVLRRLFEIARYRGQSAGQRAAARGPGGAPSPRVFERLRYAGTVLSDRPSEVQLLRAMDASEGSRVLGDAVTLTIADADPPENANESRPYVLRSRWALVGHSREASCHVDRALVPGLRAGDRLEIATDHLGSVGISAVRDGRLGFAIGAVTAVTLGDVQVRRAPERWRQWVEGMFFCGQRGEHEARVCHSVPLDITVAGVAPAHWLPHEMPDGELDVFTWQWPQVRCAVTDLPLSEGNWFEQYGIGSECVALARKGACPLVPAHTSAMLLAVDGLAVRPVASLL